MSIGEPGDGRPAAVGRYEILRELGRGNMGIVYEAKDPALARTIALKTIHPAIVGAPENRESFEARFFTEARIAAGLSHPGIVVVHDVGRDPASGILYIALEHLKGRTLAEMTAGERAVPWREAVSILARVARALHHAHCNGIVHRDMKPANVMVLDSGETKIMDFGIAKIEASLHHLTSPGESLCTPLFMAPEQASGGPVTARTDIFSLGAIGWTLLTGRPAFDGDSVLRIAVRVVHEDPGPPSRTAADVPPEVDAVIAHALAKLPEERYADAAAMAEDLEAILAGRPPTHLQQAAGEATALPGSESAHFAAADPLEALQDLLAEAPAPVAPVSKNTTAVPSPRTARGANVVTPGSDTAAASSPARPARPWLLGALMLGLLAAGYLGLRANDPSAGRPATSAPGTARAGAGSETSASSRLGGLLPWSQPEPEPEPGKLAIDFEHAQKVVHLRVWLDDDLVIDQNVAGQNQKMLVLKFHKARYEDVLEVSPGSHLVRVQASWDDNTKNDVITGVFKSGVTRRLEVRLGRLRKNLSLEWQ